MELPFDLGSPLLEETQNTNLKEYMHPYVYCSVIYNSQHLETAQMPISRWVDKKKMLWYTYTIQYYLAIKKKEILPFTTAWMDMKNTILSELS